MKYYCTALVCCTQIIYSKSIFLLRNLNHRYLKTTFSTLPCTVTPQPFCWWRISPLSRLYGRYTSRKDNKPKNSFWRNRITVYQNHYAFSHLSKFNFAANTLFEVFFFGGPNLITSRQFKKKKKLGSWLESASGFTSRVP